MAIDTSVPDVHDIFSSTTGNISLEIQSMSPSAVIELFVLDMTNINQEVLHFYGGKVDSRLEESIIWQGVSYIPLPIKAEGFAAGTNSTLPRPKIKIANPQGALSATVDAYSDLIGCKIIRKRTLAKYLDSANFPKGINPTADPNQHYPDDIWYVDQKTLETRFFIEWDLASPFDLMGVLLPRRQVICNSCPWKYKGPECGYVGTNMFNEFNIPVTSIVEDVCGKSLTSCKARFGQHAILPFGGFPGSTQY